MTTPPRPTDRPAPTHKRHKIKNMASIAAFLIAATSAASSTAQEPWPMRHKDPARTGRSSTAGQIANPSVLWQLNTGGQVNDRATLIEDVNGDGAQDYLVVVGGAVVARRLDQTLLWDTPSLGLSELISAQDFNGDGRAEVLALGQIAALLDGQTGQLLWRFENPDGSALRSITALTTDLDRDGQDELILAVARPPQITLHDFGQGFGGQTQRWLLTDAALPSNVSRPVLGDFDGDTKLALINQSRCQALFVDLNTGTIAHTTGPLTTGQFCYGLTQAADVDGDGRQELILTGAVGGSRGSVGLTVYDLPQDRVLWQHEYATDTAVTTSLAPAGALADLDGDGRMEIALSVFNNIDEVQGDDGVQAPGQWATLIYDAATGQTLAALRDRVAVGLADLRRAPGADLILREAVEGSVRVPSFGAVEIVALNQARAASTSHRIEGAQVLTQIVRGLNNVNSRDSGVVPATMDLGQGPLLLVLRRAQSANRLQALDLDGPLQIAADQPTPEGLSHTLLKVLGDSSNLDGPHAAIKTDQGSIEVRDGALTSRLQLPFTGHAAQALIAATDDGLKVLYRDSARTLVAVDPRGASLANPPEPSWRRAVTRRAGESVAVDVDGDGPMEIVHTGEQDDGTPFIELISSLGQPRWRRALLDAAAAPFALTPGQFSNNHAGLEIAALTFTLSGGAQAMTLDGATGEVISTRLADIAAVKSNPNRELFPLGDLDNNGIDDLLLLHYTTFERFDGDALAQPPDALVNFPPQTARPANSALIRGPQGQPAVFLNLFSTHKALVDVDRGETLWSVPSEPSHTAAQANHAGLSDVDGDGAWDIAIPGQFGDLTVLSSADGRPLLRLCLIDGQVRPLAEPATPDLCAATTALSSFAVADINGDGDEDLVVGTSAGWLYAISASNGKKVWAIDLGASVQDPMIADVDADGQAEVVVSTADSRLVAIDNAAISPVQQVREVLIDLQAQIVDADQDIDTSARLDALGVAWDPVEDADGYIVTLLSENLNAVTPPIAVGAQTALVFSGLSLIPGARYVARVVPFNARAGSAAPTLSDGVLITGDGPIIVGFDVQPDPFDPLADGTARLSATLAAPAGLAHVELSIFNLEDAFIGQVHAERFEAAGAEMLDFETRWDGRDDLGTLPPGIYRAQLVAFDLDGAGVADSETFTLIDGQPAEAGEPEGAPVTVITRPQEPPCCACSSPARRPEGALPGLILALAAALAWTRRRAR